MSRPFFFQPAYLWGMLVLAIPVIIHLLSMHRPARIDFSSLRFLQSAAVRAFRRRTLRRRLLLCARLAAAGGIVLLFVGLTCRRDPVAAALAAQNGIIGVWIDASASMDYREKGLPLWKQALAALDTLDDRLPPTTQRLRFDPACGEYVDGFRLHSDSAGFIRFGPIDLDRALSSWKQRTFGSGAPALLLIVSDFQQGADGVLPVLDRCRQTLPAHNHLLLISCRPDHPWNYSLRSAIVPYAGAPVLDVVVETFGKALDRGSLTVTAQQTILGHAPIAAQENSQAQASIPLPRENAASGCGAVSLAPDDLFPLDNKAGFVQNGRQTCRVLVVGGPDETFPVVNAFKALGEGRGWRPVIAGTAEQVSFEGLDSAPLIVLSGIVDPTPPLVSLLEGRLGPKAMLMAPTMDSTAGDWNRMLFSHLGAVGAPVLHTSEKPLCPVLPDTLMPLWRGFPRLRESGVAIDRWYAGIPGAPLLKLDNRQVLAALATDAAGSAYILFSSGIGVDDAGTFCQSGLFVPLIDRLARYALAEAGADTGRWIAGAGHANPVRRRPGGATVYDTAGRIIARWDAQPRVVIDKPGPCRIVSAGAPDYWIAVVVDPAETRLLYRHPSPVPGSLGILTSAQFHDLLGSRRTGLYGYLFWCLISLLLLIEVLLWEPDSVPTTPAVRDSA